MIELIFKKQSWEYTIGMKSEYSDTSEISMTLDTGSPISADSPKEAIRKLFQSLNREVTNISEVKNRDKANVFVALRGGKKKSQHYYSVKHY